MKLARNLSRIKSIKAELKHRLNQLDRLELSDDNETLLSAAKGSIYQAIKNLNELQESLEQDQKIKRLLA